MEALNLIGQISNTKLKFHPKYGNIVGRFYYRFGNLKRAVHFINRTLGEYPWRDQDYFLKAKIFMENRQYKEAKKALITALDLDPLNIKYHTLNGTILYELNGPEVAIGYLLNLLEEYKNDPTLLGSIAICYHKSGKIKEFREYQKRILKLKVKDKAFFSFLLKTASLEGNAESIVNYSKELLRIDPTDNKIRLKLGTTYLDMQKYDKAIKIFRDVITRLNSYPTAHFYLAIAYMKKNNLKQALEMGKKEIELNPKIYHGHYITGEVHRLQNEIPKAMKMLQKSVSINPNDAKSLYSLCWIKRRQNYFELALEYCLNAKEQDPLDPGIRKELANVYSSIGQSELAVDEFKVYLNLYPNAPDRKKIEKSIRTLKL